MERLPYFFPRWSGPFVTARMIQEAAAREGITTDRGAIREVTMAAYSKLAHRVMPTILAELTEAEAAVKRKDWPAAMGHAHPMFTALSVLQSLEMRHAERGFGHDVWDRGVDAYFAAQKPFVERPALLMRLSGAPIAYQPLMIPSLVTDPRRGDPAFLSFTQFLEAWDAVVGQRHEQGRWHGWMRGETDVVWLPFWISPEASSLGPCIVRPFVQAGKASDTLALEVHRLFPTSDSSARALSANAYQRVGIDPVRDEEGDVVKGALVPIGQARWLVRGMGNDYFRATIDNPVGRYVIRIHDRDGLDALAGLASRRDDVSHALVAAGFKPMAFKPGKGPRALFAQNAHGVVKIRVPWLSGE